MKRVVLALFVSGTFNAMGQVQFGSLQEVLVWADKNAQSVQTARQQEQIAISRANASRTALLPSVNGSAGFNDNITLQPTLVPASLFNPAAPEGTFNEYTFGRKYMYSAGVQANWDVLNFQKWFDVKTSEALLHLNEANTLNAKYRVYNQVAQTYYSILLTEKYLLLSRENVSTADSICRIAKDKYSTGIFTEENLNRSKIQLAQAQQQVSSIAATLQQLYNQLQSQLNTSEKIILQDRFTDNKLEVFSGNAITSMHPEVVAGEAQVKLTQQELARMQSLQYPVLTIGYQYNYNWATDKMADLSQANNLPQQFWGIKLSVPVFNGFATREKIHQSKIQLQQQQTIYSNQRLVAQKEDENLEIQYRQGIEELKRQEEILELQTKNDVHTGNRYENGIIGLDERLDKFRDLLQVQNQYVQALSNYYISYYKLYIRRQMNNNLNTINSTNDTE